MIYRVTVKTTSSLQPRSTYWQKTVVYCGTSLEEARIAYLREEPQDHANMGGPSRETVIEQLESEPEDIASTETENVEV